MAVQGLAASHASHLREAHDEAEQRVGAVRSDEKWDALLSERDALLRERDAFLSERAVAVEERDALSSQVEELGKALDSMRRENEELSEELAGCEHRLEEAEERLVQLAELPGDGQTSDLEREIEALKAR